MAMLAFWPSAQLGIGENEGIFHFTGSMLNCEPQIATEIGYAGGSIMAIPILLDEYTVPERGAFKLTINLSVEIQVTAEEARRMVKRWLIDEISYLMTAAEPTLVLGQRAIWRVPAILTAPHVGHVGSAGCVEVDVETGKILNSVEAKQVINVGVQELAKRIPPYTPRETMPEGLETTKMQAAHESGQPKGNPLDLLPAP
ncbi:MAG: hypothetical protein R3A44_07625 [Caldilineaceae bacterium]